MSNIVPVEQSVGGVAVECQQLIAAHNDINFQAESNYAIQLLYANNYALGIAQKNPVSVQNALRNASAIGISLNPASKHAYLVPRSGAICLDISYIGLLHLAQSTGSIEWGQAKLVYEADSYENQGIDKAPVHKYPAFGKRGNVVGAYCTVKTATGAYLTEEMSIDQLMEIKSRSESGKQDKGPWKTDFEEMCRKTVVKRASKYWPKVDRLNEAVNYLNTDGGEGISKDEVVRDVSPITQESEAWLTDHYNSLDQSKRDAMLNWLRIESIGALCKFTEEQAQKAITAIKAKMKK